MSELAQLTAGQWIVVGLGSVLIGISRTGIRGSAFLAIPIFAEIFGGKVSAGLVLLILIVGDIVAARYYLKNVNWRLILRLAPWTVAGIATGVVVGAGVDDAVFIRIIAVLVLGSTGLLLWNELSRGETDVPTRWWFSAVLGILGGFASMIGNAAGPIFNLYFLSMNLDKTKFIGTVAWFFFLMNLTKVPLHVFAWNTIPISSVLTAALTIPLVILGTFLGIRIAKAIPERPFRFVIMGLVVLASLRLLIA
ncbi:MAG: TSUP family transporter [Spirochaetes bacterium]|jgi:uncharacterized membrane protein YfcA|nr:TSUP family transporter [Spirochaetota bacterium]